MDAARGGRGFARERLPRDFKPGDRVHVQASAFAGTVGTVANADDPAVQAVRQARQAAGIAEPPDRVGVFVNACGRPVPLSCPAADLKPV
jgi:transcription antitermination factor NusG